MQVGEGVVVMMGVVVMLGWMCVGGGDEGVAEGWHCM